jgi:hypothetical protein
MNRREPKAMMKKVRMTIGMVTSANSAAEAPSWRLTKADTPKRPQRPVADRRSSASKLLSSILLPIEKYITQKIY